MHRLLTFFIVAILSGQFISGQEQLEYRDYYGNVTSQEDQDADEDAIIRPEDYRVGIGDTLEIQVVDITDISELNQTLKVSNLGDIDFHPVGTIHVSDLTASEVESKVASVLKDRGLLKDPQVLVYIQDYQAKRFWVSGQFVAPGEFVMSQRLTVMDAILLAGGLGALASEYGFLHRSGAQREVTGPPTAVTVENPEMEREGVEIIRINLAPLKVGRLPEPDLPLREGDYFIVPRREVDFYFVLGEVMFPLNYIYPSDRTLSASQAIAGAGGPTKTAKLSEGKLVRYDAAGARQEMPIDFQAIIEGRQDDFDVLPNDVIFIPGSNIRTIGEGFIWAANAMIAGTAFRVGRRYQLPDSPSSNSRSLPDEP